MSTTTYGQPATIDQASMPPAAKNIASSTFTSPTVITTSAAHNLHTGQAVIIRGHSTNTNANGIWIVTVLSGTTFKISTFAGFISGPTYVNGNGVGGATGTVQSLAFPGVALPQDATDDRDASSVNVPFEMLLDSTAWLAYKILANMTILAGGGFTIANEATWNLGGTGVLSGTLDVVAASIGITSGSVLAFAANGRTTNTAPVYLTDGNHTVSRASGPMSILATPSAGRVITILEAGDADLQPGNEIEFHLPTPNFVAGAYNLKRQSAGAGVYVCTINGAIAGSDAQGYARLYADASGHWRLRDGYGIILGPDA